MVGDTCVPLLCAAPPCLCMADGAAWLLPTCSLSRVSLHMPSTPPVLCLTLPVSLALLCVLVLILARPHPHLCRMHVIPAPTSCPSPSLPAAGRSCSQTCLTLSDFRASLSVSGTDCLAGVYRMTGIAGEGHSSQSTRLQLLGSPLPLLPPIRCSPSPSPSL